jgi:hypothetical protein
MYGNKTSDRNKFENYMDEEVDSNEECRSLEK